MSPQPAFVRRAEALDRLEWESDGPGEARRSLLLRAQTRAAAGLRRRLRAGRIPPAGLRRAFARLAGAPGARGLDALDALVGLLFAGDEPGEPTRRLGAEEVPYQPSPARVLLAMAEALDLGPEDRLCDLGSGLGSSAILLAWLSGAALSGIEAEPAYHAYAQRAARRLRVPRVGFVLGDARDAPLGEADVYYLFTPFKGALLASVLQRLRGEAADRPLRVAAYGPCVAVLDRQAWLARLPGPGDAHGLALYRPLK